MQNSQSQPEKVLVTTHPLVFTQKISIAIALASGVIFIPSFIHQQFITGPVINALLLIASVLLSPVEAMFLGLIPSTVALSRGLLPVALAAMVPFIMISNSLYIVLFQRLYKKTIVGAVVLASLVKFLFLFTLSNKILASLLPASFISKVTAMMSWPQLATALVGGLIAYLLLKIIKRL